MASPSWHGFSRLFNPETVAVFGSVKKDKISHQLITQLLQGGFPGRIVAVNPKGESPEGFAAVPGCAGLEQADRSPDLALIAVPAPHVELVIRACGEKKVPFAVVFTSGFSEVGNSAEETRLKQVAAGTGVRLIGPNCAGIMNTAAHLFASIEVRALPGRTAFISQSGAVGGAVLALAETRGIGFSKFVSYGNRADIGEVELLEYLDSDPETRVIALYLESLQNGREFMACLRRVCRRKPVAIIKAGRSLSGLRAASSHTGSLAGSDEVFAAMIRQTGALRVPGIEEMLDLCDGLTALPPMRGKRLAIVTNSGGPGILTSDRAEELGLEVRETTPEARAKLGRFLPAHCAFTNPIDLTVEGTREGYRNTLQTVLADYDGAIAINVATPFLDSVSLADGIVEAARGTASAGRRAAKGASPDPALKKPVAAVFMAGEIVAEGISKLKRCGIPVFPTGERAAFVLARMQEYTERVRTLGSGETAALGAEAVAGDRAEPRPAADGAPFLHDAPAAAAGVPFPPGAPVPEPEAVAFLENEGFPFPARALVTDPRQLNEAVARIGFPLVMKVVSPRILHKSDVGGVILNLQDEEQVRRGFEEMSVRFREQEFRGVMLYRQIAGGLEVIAGVSRDPTFGPVVLVGVGGVLTELLRDSALRIAPFEEAEAERMLAELKIDRLLSGYRGGVRLDRQALVELLVRLSRLAVRYPAIRELDFNPILVQEKGLEIADARIIAG